MSKSTGKVPWHGNSSPISVSAYENAVQANLYHFIEILAADDPVTFAIDLILVDQGGDIITTNYGVLLTAE